VSIKKARLFIYRNYPDCRLLFADSDVLNKSFIKSPSMGINNSERAVPKNHKSIPSCAECQVETNDKRCMEQTGKPAAGCPTLVQTAVLERANAAYEDPETLRFAYQASVQEAEAYANRDQKPYVMQPHKTRVVEICEFAQRMGYRRLGVAFCMGLAKEAEVFADLLKNKGFDVISVVCKAGCTPKTKIGITEEHTIDHGLEEAMCNPIFQAELLNHEECDFNILLGLCVGHDSLFFKHAKAPTTVLAVKDRVTGHNPLAAIYTLGSYYRKIKILP
jgi:uncharacterized metal-binding protein